MEALELRRLQFDVVYVYRILFSKLEMESKLSFSLNSITRGHPDKFLLSHCHSVVRKYFLVTGSYWLWNELKLSN